MSTRIVTSIILPVFNNPSGIETTLNSLFKQDYPLELFEIIVVDNASTDSTFDRIQALATQFRGNITTTIEPQKGSYSARNRGIQLAKGQVLAFIDADMTVASDWLRRGATKIIESRKEYVGCRIDVVPHSPPSFWERFEMCFGFPVKAYMENDGFAPTAGLFVADSLIAKIGVFDGSLLSGGDLEFGVRAKNHGVELYYDADNIMFHPARRTLRELLKKRKRVTLGQISLRKKYSDKFPSNRVIDFLYFVLQLFPVVHISVIRKLRGNGGLALMLGATVYMLRLYSCVLKIRYKCIF